MNTNQRIINKIEYLSTLKKTDKRDREIERLKKLGVIRSRLLIKDIQ